MTLHHNELPVDGALVRTLLTEQCPEWADLPLAYAGSGTDNTMFRLGDDLLVRLPRTPDNEPSVRREQKWLPRLAPRLTLAVPEPVFAGTPTSDFPLAWSVYRWIEGAPPGPETVEDWAAFGTDLAAFVRELHGLDLMGATRADGLDGYRGGILRSFDPSVSRCFAECRDTVGASLDVATLERLWRAALDLPQPSGPHVWLHSDLRPANLLVRDGRLRAVIDFGALAIGFPDAEHAPVWDLPAPARQAYRNSLDLDDLTWSRARAWAIGVGVVGLAYYWSTYPEFVTECQARLRAILDDAATR